MRRVRDGVRYRFRVRDGVGDGFRDRVRVRDRGYADVKGDRGSGRKVYIY